jgi:hypothetical protein
MASSIVNAPMRNEGDQARVIRELKVMLIFN